MSLFLPYFLSSLLPLSFFPFFSFLLLYHCGFFPPTSLFLFSLPPSSMGISSFYGEFFSMGLPLRLHQLLLVSFGHSFRTTHKPIGCLTTTSAQRLVCYTTPCSRTKPSFVFFFLSTHLSCLTQMDKGSSPSLYLPL